MSLKSESLAYLLRGPSWGTVIAGPGAKAAQEPKAGRVRRGGPESHILDSRFQIPEPRGQAFAFRFEKTDQRQQARIGERGSAN